jgi:hypothetical protein
MRKFTLLLVCILTGINCILNAQVNTKPSSTNSADLNINGEIKRKQVPININDVYQARSWYVYAGFGIPNMLKPVWRSFEDYAQQSSNNIGTYTLKIERTTNNGWGICAGASYTSGAYAWKVSVPDSNNKPLYFDQGFTYNNTSAFGGIQYSLYFNELVSIYSSVCAGMNFTNISTQNDGSTRVAMPNPKTPNPLFYNAAFGAKIHFTPRFGMYLETGVGRLQAVGLGVTARLNNIKLEERQRKAILKPLE